MTERLTLFDLRRKTAVVEAGGIEIEIHGLSARAILGMMDNWSAVQKFLVGLTISNEEAFKAAPGVLIRIIAHGVTPVDAPPSALLLAEEAAADLPASLQLLLMTAIWNMTFTEGFGPFMARMRVIAGAASVGDGKAPDMKSRRRSRTSPPNTAGTTETPGTKPPESSPPGTSSPAAESSAEPAIASTS